MLVLRHLCLALSDKRSGVLHQAANRAGKLGGVVGTYDEVGAVDSLGRNGTSEDNGGGSETHFD